MKIFTWKGCLFGCLGLIALVVIVTVGTGIWLTKKGTFEAESTILAPDSEFYLRSYLRREDTVLVDFFSSLANRINENNPAMSNFPTFFKNWQKNQSRKDILKMLPLEIEVSLMPSADRFHASAGFSLYNNLMSVAFWFFKRSAREDNMVRVYKDHEYVLLDNEPPICIALENSVFYLANNEDAMKAIVDPDRPLVSEHPGEARLEGLDLEAPLYGFIGGEGCAWNWAEEVKYMDLDVRTDGQNPEPIPPEALAFLERVTRVGFDLAVDDPDTVSGHVLLDTQDRSETMKAGIEQAIELLTRRDHLKTEYAIETTPSGFTVTYKVTGFANAAAAVIPVR